MELSIDYFNIIKDKFIEWNDKLTDQKELGKNIRTTIRAAAGVLIIKILFSGGVEYGKLKIGGKSKE